MEGGREGRRGGSVSAPRRPRTCGFKDAPVGDDGDDLVDDVLNARSRERSKKVISSVSAVQGLPSGSLVSVFRKKRKRQGSQEEHVQIRVNTANDSDVLTEDTDMGVSEDDDDLPPPPVPRRPGKLRPQGKFLEEGISADLPAVPRKARTAILKRPQESSSPPVDASSHQGSTAIPRTPAPSSAPSSSSVVSLKPGRRTKPNTSKPRAPKVSKVATSTIISEKEVEVAEALSDLARMFTSHQPSSTLEETADKIVESNVESKPEVDLKVEPDVKSNPDASTDKIVASPCRPLVSSPQLSTPISSSLAPSQIVTDAPLALFTVYSASATSAVPLSATPISSVPLPEMATASDPAMTTTWPSESPPPVNLLPPAEAPKRKRPRVRTRVDEVGSVPYIDVAVYTSSGFDVGFVTETDGTLYTSSSFNAPRLNPEYKFTSCSPSRTDNGLGGSEPEVPASSLPTALPTKPLSIAAPAFDLLDSGPQELALSVPLDTFHSPAKTVAKVVVRTTSLSQEKKQILALNRKPPPVDLSSPPSLAWDAKSTLNSPSENTLNKQVDFNRRSSQESVSTGDGGRSNKVEFDLGSRSGNLTQSPSEKRTAHVNPVNDVSHKSPKEDTSRESEVRLEDPKPEEQDRGTGVEYEEEVECEGQSDRGEIGKLNELPKEGEAMEDVQDNVELAEKSLKRSGKSLQAESRGQKAEGAGLFVDAAAGNATSLMLTSALQCPSASVTNVSSSTATGPLSIGMAGWPLGMSPMRYYGSIAAVAPPIGWSRAAPVDETSLPAVQQPFIIQRQPQHWKRCASHVYIAHFIDMQQQINRHPFFQAAYQNPTNLYGSKQYNLNRPPSPAEVTTRDGSVGSLVGHVSGVVGPSVGAGCGSGPGLTTVSGSERCVGILSPMTNVQLNYSEVISRKQTLQVQPSPHLPSSLPVQAGTGFGFPVAQPCTSVTGSVATSSAKVSPLRNPGAGGLSALVGMNTGLAVSTSVSSPAVAGSPAGSSNSGVGSHGAAQAQYLQAVLHQSGFPFPFQAAAPFGHTFNNLPGHIGHQQTAPYFSKPLYTTHLVHPPAIAQQQVQQSTNASSGLSSVPPPYSQQPRTHGLAAQHLQRSAEREGLGAGDMNSSAESKFPILLRNIYGQGNSNVAVASVTAPSSLVLAGGIQSGQPQDFNLKAALGGKQAKTQQPGQLAPQKQISLQQQKQVSAQHHGSSAGFQMNLTGIDQQPSQALPVISVAAMNRTALGPGPLGLAPVAAVMAPQGHAMLQNMGDSSRGPAQHPKTQHQQLAVGQSHQHSFQCGQQLQQPVHTQRASSVVNGVEDGRTTDGNPFTGSRNGRDSVDERKGAVKRGMGSTSTKSRVEIDSPETVQASNCGLPVPRMSGSVCPTLNLMTATSAVCVSPPAGHSPGSTPQQPGHIVPGTLSARQVVSQSKSLAASANSQFASSAQSQQTASDRVPLGSSSCKALGPQLSLSGQAMAPSIQAGRQGLVPQHAQLKLSSRGSLGSLPTPSEAAPQAVPQLSLSGQAMVPSTQAGRQGLVPQHAQLKLSSRGSLGSLQTPSEAAPQAVLAAAIAKSQQVSQQQLSRPQAPLGANALTQFSCGNMTGSSANTSSPVPQSVLSKSTPTSCAKSNPANKSSISVSHKLSGSVSSKRSTPVSMPHVSSMLSPSFGMQNLPSKPGVQQNVHHSWQPPKQQHHQNPSQDYITQQPPLQSLQQPLPQSPHVQQQHQPYHQPAHVNSQHLQQVHGKQTALQHQQTHHMQRHIFLQNPVFHQQPSQQINQHASSLSAQPQPQQQLSSPQPHHHQQQQHVHHQQQQQKNMQGGSGSFPVAAANGSLSLESPTLTLGTGSNGSSTSPLPASSSDGLAAPQGSGPKSSLITSKGMSSSGISLANTHIQRCQIAGPTFIHNQLGSSMALEKQQLGSSSIGSAAQYLQPVINSGASGKVAEQKAMSGT